MINILIFSLELLLCIGVFYFAKKYFKNTMGKLSTAVLVVILTTVLFLVNSWVQETPVIYDKVRVEALNEKSDSSMGVEVSINGMKTSIGQQFFPEVVEGKWFFTTESNYMWRPEYDLRQPKGTTREIVLNVPVGKDRILLFKKSEWGGKAVVKCCGGKSLIDTNLEAQVNLTDSSFKRRLFQAACKIALFGLIVGAFVALLYVLVRIYQSDDKKLKNKSTYFLIAITFILLVSPHLHTQEFWLDEMFQIGFSGTGKSLYETLMVTETTPPLFRLIANIWYNLMPYGEEWLLLLPTLFSAGFIYVMGLLGEHIGGKYTGYASSLLAAFSTALLTSGVREFRSNALLALLSALYMLYYVKRLKTGKYTVAISLIMILLAYTHYFGVFLCGAAFLLDVIFLFNRKKNIKAFIPYIITGLVFLPWIFRFIELDQIGLKAFWQIKPTLSAIYNLMIYLCSTTTILLAFVVGVIVSFFDKKQETKDFDIRISLIFITFIMIACIYAYGTYLNPQATLWTHRYFLNILPCIITIAALGIVWIGKFFVAGFKKVSIDIELIKISKRMLCILLPMFLAITNIPRFSANYNPPKGNDYKGAAESIYGHVDVYNEDSLVVMLCQDYVVDGWYEYYMTMQGRRDDIDYASITTIPAKEDEAEAFFAPYKTIYQCYLQEYTCNSFTQQINKHYQLVHNDATTCVKIYKRID